MARAPPSPGAAQVGPVRNSGPANPDLIELGELAIISGHDRVVANHAVLVRNHLDVGIAQLAVEPDVDRFASAQIAGPAE